MSDYSYDRTAAAVSELKKVLDQKWNDLHDLAYDLESSGRQFDQAASYLGGEGRDSAQEVLKALKAAVKAIEAVADEGGALDKLAEAERAFVKDHGAPAAYIKEQQDKMGLR